MALNWGGAGMGALSGAGTGSTIGSLGGPMGTGIGAGVGGIVGLLSGLFSGNQSQGSAGQMQPQSGNSGEGGLLWGSPEQFGQQSSYSPANQQQFDQLISQLLQGFSNNNNFDFSPIEQQARSNFAEQTVPGIAERFTSMGGGGGRSSAFANQLGAAGAGLERDLAAQKQGFNMQQQGLNQNLLRLGQQTPFHAQRQPGLVENAGSGAMQAASSFLNGPGGGALVDRLLGLLNKSGGKTSMGPGGIQTNAAGNMFSPVSYRR